MTKHLILKRDELLDMPIEEQRALMKSWREQYSVEKICKESNIPKGGSFYNYLRYLGLPTSKSRGTKKDRGIATLNLYEKKNQKRGGKVKKVK